MATTSNLISSSSPTAGLTRWSSNTNRNTPTITDSRNRLRVFYDTGSTFQITIGGGGYGPAYYFFEFAAGNTFASTEIFYQVSGNVLNDTNGLVNSTVDGSGLHQASGTQLYASLVNSNDSVISTVPVASDGSYIFPVVADGDYNVILTRSQPTLHSTGNTSSLPSNWENTGENIGVSTGSDGTNDGDISVTVNGGNISSANFGINKRPESTSLSQQITLPLFGDSLLVGSTSLLTVGPSGTDNEDGTIANPSSIYVTSLPSGTNQLLYNGVVITLGTDGVNAPSSTNPFIISNFDKSLMKFVVLEGTSVEFDYAVVDAAGLVDLSPATYRYSWIGVVPVEFVSINAEQIENNSVEINWITATELNNERFEVLRKFEGEDEFSQIGIVSGAGNSSSLIHYSYTDIMTRPFDLVYYKLKQIDFDGKYEFSKVVSVTSDEVVDIVIYPNPANGKLIVDFGASVNTTGGLEMLDQVGRVVLAEQVSDNQVFDLTNIEPGIYSVRITVGTSITTSRVLISH